MRPEASDMCMLMLSASPHLFACCVVARTLQAVVVGTVTDDRLWQALQEKEQGFSYRMIASGFWPMVKEPVMLLPVIRRGLEAITCQKCCLPRQALCSELGASLTSRRGHAVCQVSQAFLRSCYISCLKL